MKYYLVDVFAREPYSGNQLAVFLCDQWPRQDLMQSIAKEVNLAETIFLRKIKPDKFEVRIFLIDYEIPFAGHPIIGASYIAKKFLNAPQSFTLSCKKGLIPINNEANSFFMDQPEPEFLEAFNKAEITSFTNLKADDFDDKFSVERLSNGLHYIIVPLKNLSAIAGLRIDYLKWIEFLKSKKLHASNSSDAITTSLYFFTQETEEADHDYHARMFCDEHNTANEDAASGSAAGCLAGYLTNTLKVDMRIVLEQGYEKGRPSLLYLESKRIDGKYNIKLGGEVQFMAEGQWQGK